MRSSIRFILGHDAQEIESVDPTMTVLDWLRLHRGRVGTKEGCGEGDCGACTVVVGRLVDGSIRYEAVNACIRLLPTLDGCHLLTVEDLRSPDGALHPAQQAMVECHGSQCGFCTPGFVMSLFSLYLNESNPDENRIDEALAGNLCRCTGYAPIVRAARRMYEIGDPKNDRFAAELPDVIRRLKALNGNVGFTIGEGGRRFDSPTSIPELVEILEKDPDARLVAGTTDVGLWITKDLRVLDHVVYIGRIGELRTVTETPDALEIGAAVTLTEAEPAISRLFPDFGELIRRFGAVQVRNMATLGGNVANGSPIGDCNPALIALNATIVMHKGDARRSLAVEKFFVDYGRQDRERGEFIERIVIPKLGPGDHFRAYKLSKRFDQDISAVCGTFLMTLDSKRYVSDIRLAFGGMAATARRAVAAEAAVRGRRWDEATIEHAIDVLNREFTPLTDWRGSTSYRRRAAGNILRKFYAETTGVGARTRLVGHEISP